MADILLPACGQVQASFFRHKKRLRRIEHLQDLGFILFELYFNTQFAKFYVRANRINLCKTGKIFTKTYIVHSLAWQISRCLPAAKSNQAHLY